MTSHQLFSKISLPHTLIGTLYSLLGEEQRLHSREWQKQSLTGKYKKNYKKKTEFHPFTYANLTSVKLLIYDLVASGFTTSATSIHVGDLN